MQSLGQAAGWGTQSRGRPAGCGAQSRGRTTGSASLRRSALWADCPALLGARGLAPNSPSHGRHAHARAYARCSNMRRSTPRLAASRNPRTPALLGAAEALRPPPARDSAQAAFGRLDDALLVVEWRMDKR